MGLTSKLAVATALASSTATVVLATPPHSTPAAAVDTAPYIVGGSDVTAADNAPWLAAVLYGSINNPTSAVFCTGTLITPTHVLTAGHCVKDRFGDPVALEYHVVVGIPDLNDVGPSDRIEAIPAAEPSWTGSSGVDLAILTLETPVDDIKPLPILPSAPGVGDTVTAYGWGGLLEADDVNNEYPDVAQKGTMRVTTGYGDVPDGCGFGPGAVEPSHQFCFGDPDQAVCYGDSGGPIVMLEDGNPYLVGVTSQGPEVCNDNFVDEIAERVIDSVPWVESYVGPAICVWNSHSAGADTYEGWIVPCWAAPASGASIPFVDVNFGLFYIEGVKWLWSNSITTGTSPTTFSPDDPVTRGQLAAFLWRFAGDPEASGQPYGDVVAPWQQEPVAWLAAWGFTTGTSPTTFSPDDHVTRAQLVTFLWRLVGSPPTEGASYLTDIELGKFYTEAVSWATFAGVTTGYPDGSFKPYQAVTRGEMATFLLRLAELVEGQAG